MDGMKRHQITASLPRNSGDSKRSVDILDEDDKFLNGGSNFSQHKQRNKYRYFHDDNHASVVGVNDNKLYRHQIMSAQRKLAQQTQQSFPTSATVRKMRSNSFHEDRDQSDDLTSDPEVALRLLQHQNRRQRCRLNEIQQENFMLLKLSSTNNDKPSNLNRRSDFFSALNQHLGCRLDLLNNKIDSQQLVIDSMNEQYQQQLAMPNHLKHFDVAMLQKLFNEQSVIDQELKFECESHKRSSSNSNNNSSKSHRRDVDSGERVDRDDLLEREIDGLKLYLHQKIDFNQSDDDSTSKLVSYWNQVVNVLCELDAWMNRLDEACMKQQPIGGDLQTLKSQRKELQTIQSDLEDRRILLEKVVETSNMLLQEDSFLKHMHLQTEHFSKTKKRIEELSYHVPQRWVDIRQKVFDCLVLISSTSKKLHILQKLLDEVSVSLKEATENIFWLPVEKLGCDNLISELKRAKTYHQSVTSLKSPLDGCNTQANQLQDTGIVLSHKYVSKMEENNRRWKELLSSIEHRMKQLTDILKMKDQSLKIFLSMPVQASWERALTANNVPYYINHKSESTHWDHPEMTNLLHDLSTLNAVRFSAYRTAMKLRMLQFRLKLSSASLKTVHEYLISSAPQSRDATVGVSDVVTWLLDLYPADAPTFDLTLNWLFNVYDIHRTGHFNLLSIKVALMLLSNASLEEKFKKLFELVCDERALMSSTQLSSLLMELMKVPQQLGEDYSFGGLNVQPSVKSCFERAMSDDMIDCDQFLEWTRMEPQSVVWLHVMHRLCAAERSLHQVRCAICRIMPISGIRYRCLKCFNFDMCQNCFFAGSTTKNHKLNHPMQEYSSEATSGDEMRDLKVVLKNKFRSKQYFKKHPRLGYLPVQPSSSETNTIDRSQSTSPQMKYFAGRTNSIDKTADQKTLNNSHTYDHHTVRTNVSNTNKDSGVNMNQINKPNKDMDKCRSTSTTNKYSKFSLVPVYQSEEHSLIAKYCQNLHGNETPVGISLDDNGVGEGRRIPVEELIHDLEHENQILQEEYNQLKLVRSEPSLFCRELSVDTGSEVLNKEDFLRQHKNRLEARIQYLEGHNRQIESTLDQLKQIRFEPENMRIVTYTKTPQVDAFVSSYQQNDLYHPPPPFRNSQHQINNSAF